MKIEKILAAVAAAAMTAAMTGCSNGTGGGDGADGGNNAAGVLETSNVEGTVQTEAAPEKEYSEMVQRSFVSLGNTYRLEDKLSKALQGEEITVAYLGGSITEGVGGTTATFYSKLSYKYISENYSKGDNVK